MIGAVSFFCCCLLAGFAGKEAKKTNKNGFDGHQFKLCDTEDSVFHTDVYFILLLLRMYGVFVTRRFMSRSAGLVDFLNSGNLQVIKSQPDDLCPTVQAAGEVHLANLDCFESFHPFFLLTSQDFISSSSHPVRCTTYDGNLNAAARVLHIRRKIVPSRTSRSGAWAGTVNPEFDGLL